MELFLVWFGLHDGHVGGENNEIMSKNLHENRV